MGEKIATKGSGGLFTGYSISFTSFSLGFTECVAWTFQYIIHTVTRYVTAFLVARWLKFSDARQFGAKKHSKKPVVYVAFIFNQKKKDRSISFSFQRRKDDIFKHGGLD